jgi:hypothetical protein
VLLLEGLAHTRHAVATPVLLEHPQNLTVELPVGPGALRLGLPLKLVEPLARDSKELA